MSFREVPKLCWVEGEWILDPFSPIDAGQNWPQYEGKIGQVYVLSCEGYMKIGMSKSAAARAKDINNACPFHVELRATLDVPLSGMALAEGYLHCKFVAKRHKNEWFKVDLGEIEAEFESAKLYADTFDRQCEEYYFRDRAKRGTPEFQANIKAQHLSVLKTSRNNARRHMEEIERALQEFHPESAA